MSSVDVGPIKRLVAATRYSLNGLGVAWHTEAALRYEFYATPALVLAAVIANVTTAERILLVGSWLFVIVVELLNSAIEAIVDRIGREHHELSGRAKDLGSAAVFCAIILAAITWLMILFG